MNYGRYQIVKELGKGSMGIVYQAHDPQIDRPVALKVLRSDLVTSEEFVQRFLKEARAIGRLSHPNIVMIHDVGRDHGTIYIAMEFVAGDRLDKLMEEKELTEKEIIDLGIEAAKILDYAHQSGIVHRDIKPSNIMLGTDSQLKITDFGIAHIEDPSAPQLTQAGACLHVS
jgi:serine/threonine-protein kinase